MMDHILIIGLGSIGRRHLRHFRSAGVKRIDALRSGLATLPDEGQPQPDFTFTSIDEAFAAKPKGIIICTPTSLHTIYILRAIKHGIPVLCEKPVTHTLEEARQIEKEAGASPVFIAHNLRFHKGLTWIREQILAKRFGVALMAQAHFGAYLPDWHPWENYLESYAALKKLGGGAVLTHTHEPDYLSWFFGGIITGMVIKSDLHPLGTDVDEQSIVMMRHSSGVISSASLSLGQKPARRHLHIQFDKGILNFNLLDLTLYYVHADGSKEDFSELLSGYDTDESYALQARAFINTTNGQPSALCTLQEGINIMNTITNTI